LFTRNRAGLRLTAKGADLVATAHEVLGTATNFEPVASVRGSGSNGRSGSRPNKVLGARSLQVLLAAFMAEHTMFEIEFGISNEVTNPLQRDADITIRIMHPTRTDLVARKPAMHP
jgi:DNA-binding transcriptional LysR family regulator